MRFGHHRFQLFHIVIVNAVVGGIGIAKEFLITFIRSTAQITAHHIVRLDDAVHAPCFHRHIGQSHALINIQSMYGFAGKFHCPIGCTVRGNITENPKNQILGCQIFRHLTFKNELHAFGNFFPDFTGAQNESRVGITHTGGKQTESSGRTGV